MPRFDAPDGRTYRVRDIVFGVPPASPGRAVRLPFGDARATSRIFLALGEPVPALIRSYRFTALGADRGGDPATLARQFTQCAWWDPRTPEQIAADRDLTNAGHMGG